MKNFGNETMSNKEMNKKIKAKTANKMNDKKNKNDLAILENLKKARIKNMQNKENIISVDFSKRKNKKISDSEINSLFLGLVRIVKKNAEQSLNEELKNECFEATQNFRQTLIDLNKTESELKKEKEKNYELSLKIESQKEQICSLLQKLSQHKLK